MLVGLYPWHFKGILKSDQSILLQHVCMCYPAFSRSGVANPSGLGTWKFSLVAQKLEYAGGTGIWEHSAGNISAWTKAMASWQMVLCLWCLWNFCKLGISVWIWSDFCAVYMSIVKIEGKEIFLSCPSWCFLTAFLAYEILIFPSLLLSRKPDAN